MTRWTSKRHLTLLVLNPLRLARKVVSTLVGDVLIRRADTSLDETIEEEIIEEDIEGDEE
eukprot:767700-Hanusia_phi.AAC.9